MEKEYNKVIIYRLSDNPGVCYYRPGNQRDFDKFLTEVVRQYNLVLVGYAYKVCRCKVSDNDGNVAEIAGYFDDDKIFHAFDYDTDSPSFYLYNSDEFLYRRRIQFAM